METPAREGYLSDVADDGWAFVVPCLSLMDAAAPQRRHDLREVSNGLRYVARGGLQWRPMPNDLPLWEAVCQRTRRWVAAGVCELTVHDSRGLVRPAQGRTARPTAAMLDGRTLRSTPESGARAGCDGAERMKGAKVHVAVDTLGQPLAPHVAPANVQERSRVGALAAAVQAATVQTVEVAYVDQGYVGADQALDAADRGIRMEVVKLEQAKPGFLLLPW